MPRFAETIAKKVRDADVPSQVSEDLIAAADCLSKFRVSNFSSSEYPELEIQGVTAQEAVEIEEALLILYRKNPSAEGIATVLWALTLSQNPKLQPLFLQHAEAAMRRLSSACVELGHALSGLENSGDLEEYGKNRSELMAETIDKADAYLRREGIIVPIG